MTRKVTPWFVICFGVLVIEDAAVVFEKDLVTLVVEPGSRASHQLRVAMRADGRWPLSIQEMDGRGLRRTYVCGRTMLVTMNLKADANEFAIVTQDGVWI